MDKILRETTYLCVEMLNSRLQAKEKLSHVVRFSKLKHRIFPEVFARSRNKIPFKCTRDGVYCPIG